MRRSAFLLVKFQIVILIAVISLMTVLMPMFVPAMRESASTVTYTAVGCIFSSLVGGYLLRSVRNYPGVEDAYYAVPAFLVAYSLLILVLVLARVPYSRLLLISAFSANILVSVAISAFSRRHILHHIGVVAFGDYQRLIETPGVQWRLLKDVDTSLHGLDSVSADLWCDLPDEWERKLASLALRGIPVYHAKHLRESLTGKVEVEVLSENNFGTLSPLYAYMTVKHACDWIMALLVLIVATPMLLIIGLMIKSDSPGPVVFRQIRIGYQGRPFWMFKFRTMTIAAADPDIALDAAMTKDNDQRITQIGRFLRRSRLDELPQLFNILRGQMSWIGPRPEAEVLSRWYENEIPFYRYRHIVRPGITGWAQVNQGHVADVQQVREKLHFDFYYIKNFSFWIDAIVVIRTVKTMMTGFGSR